MSNFIKVPILRGFTEIEVIYDLIKDKNVYICGGYARYCCSPNKEPTPSKDLDIYCHNDDRLGN